MVTHKMHLCCHFTVINNKLIFQKLDKFGHDLLETISAIPTKFSLTCFPASHCVILKHIIVQYIIPPQFTAFQM